MTGLTGKLGVLVTWAPFLSPSKQARLPGIRMFSPELGVSAKRPRPRVPSTPPPTPDSPPPPSAGGRELPTLLFEAVCPQGPLVRIKTSHETQDPHGAPCPMVTHPAPNECPPGAAQMWTLRPRPGPGPGPLPRQGRAQVAQHLAPGRRILAACLHCRAPQLSTCAPQFPAAVCPCGQSGSQRERLGVPRHRPPTEQRLALVPPGG